MQEATQEKCPHCGASMKMYWHRLTPGIIRALIKARSHVYTTGQNQFHLYKDLTGEHKLTTAEQMNWTKLRFHGLVAKCTTDGERDAGYWLITSRGFKFLRGEIQIPIKVQTFRNRVTDHADQLVTITQVMGSTPYFEKRDQFDYEFYPVTLPEPTPEAMPIPVEFDEKGQGMLV